jgi:lipopolysaccharide export system protein LptA
MGTRGYKPFFLLAVLFVGMLSSNPAGSEPLKKEIKRGSPQPFVIKSRTLEVDDTLKRVTFTGDVSASKDDFVIHCQEMLVSYEDLSAQKNSVRGEARIDKIVATGKVRIVRVQGGMATAEKAVYYQQDERVVLTGNPMVKRGKDFVEGDQITIFLRENRSVVEGSKDKKVRATIFPKQEKR